MINFSKLAARELSDTWRRLINSGEGFAFLEFFSGTLPRSVDDPAPVERMLARLRLQPTKMLVEDGQATRSGDAGWARIIGSDGRAVADFTVSEKTGDGFLKFNTVGFRKNGPVTIFGPLSFFRSQRRDEEDED